METKVLGFTCVFLKQGIIPIKPAAFWIVPKTPPKVVAVNDNKFFPDNGPIMA